MKDTVEFRKRLMGVVNILLKGLLFEFRADYFREKDRKLRAAKKKIYQDAERDFLKIHSVLGVMERVPVSGVYVMDETGKLYDCTEPNPKDLKDNDLANVLIEFSKELR